MREISGSLRSRLNDQRLFFCSHPVLYPLLGLLSLRPIIQIGSLTVISDPDVVRNFLLRAPIDRMASGTTGATVREATGVSTLFAAEGETNRALRGDLLKQLNDPRTVEVFEGELAAICDQLGSGQQVDVVPGLRRAAGVTASTLLGLSVDSDLLMTHIDALVDAGARAQLHGRGDVVTPTRELAELLGSSQWYDEGLLHSLAADRDESFAISSGVVALVAAATTSVAASTRAIAWCADGREWNVVARDPDRAAARYLGDLTPSPLLPRRVRDDFEINGRQITPRMSVLLNLRAACRRGDDVVNNLAFGFGPFACPGAALARRQLSAVLSRVGVHNPRVVARLVGRGRALPRWDRLVLEAR